MPEISRFYGIVVRMFHREHGVPHFHAYYGGRMAVFAIEPLALLRGSLPSRAQSFVVEWAGQHRLELLDDWERATTKRTLSKIAPLE